MRSCTPLLAVLALACQDQGIQAVNAPPEAAILSHADGAELLEGSVETFRGTVSDPDHPADQLQASWYLGTDRVCGPLAPDEQGATSCEALVELGDESLTLEVQDPKDAAGSEVITLVVQPTEAPQVSILSPQAGDSFYADQLITFQGLVGDSEDEPDTLLAWWESSLDLVLEVEATPDASGQVLGYGSLSEGEHALELWAEDSHGKTGTASVTITVGPANSAPECEITAPEDGSAGPEGELVTFEALVSDADLAADGLQVSWSSDKDGELGSSTPDSSGAVVFPFADLTLDTHVVTMTVADEVEATCTAAIIYSVGNPPSVTLESPGSGALYNDGDTIAFSATVSDGQDSPEQLALDWSSDLDGGISSQGADSTGQASFTSAALSTGTHSLTLTVTDTDGLYATAVGSFTVNALPTAPTVGIAPDPALTSDDLSATASGSSDPDASGTISYAYAWYEEGALSGASASAVFPASATSKGLSYRVVVTPSDGTGDGATGQAEITVDNSDPVITTPLITPATGVTSTTTLSCSASASDPDGDTPTIGYAWSAGSTSLGTGSGLRLDPAAVAPGDTVSCSATASDDEGATDSASASVNVGNSDPIIDSVTITPSSGINTSSALSCAATASDPDGGSPSIGYAWSTGSTSLGTGSTVTLSSSSVSRGDAVTCTATATDLDGGSGSDSTSVTVGNSAPSIASVSISPGSPSALDTLSCSYSGYSDPDGDADASTYGWTVGSSSAGSGSTLSGAFARGDSVTCTVTPSDGTDAGTALSDTVTVGNAAPSISAMSTSPSSVYTDDRIAVSVSSSDVDGDSVALSYAWTVDGAAVSTSSSLSGVSWFDKHQVVQVTVTPFDGTDTGTSVSSTAITVLNSPPTAPVVSIDPSDPGASHDDLLCEIDTASTDDDGDSIDYGMAWTVDGLSYSAGGGDTGDTGGGWLGPFTTTWSDDSVSGEDTLEDEEWTCSATPDDGDDAGSAGEGSVTILSLVEEICTLEVSDPASDSSTSCSFTPTEAGLLRATMSNPDASLDGIFQVGSSTTGYLYLPTGARSWMYRGPQTEGWSSYDAELNLDSSMGALSLSVSYSTEGGADYTGADSVLVEFVPGEQLSTSGATLIASHSSCATCTTPTTATGTVPAGGRLLVEATSCGSGGGGQAVYADNDADTTNDGRIKIYTGASFICSNPLQSHAIDAGAWDFTLENEDDYWDDNTGTRAFSLYSYLP